MRRATRDALQQAIDDVNRLENLPITYLDTVPRRDLVAMGATARRWPACCCCWRPA